jgi:uncharacterized protein YkwD
LLKHKLLALSLAAIALLSGWPLLADAQRPAPAAAAPVARMDGRPAGLTYPVYYQAAPAEDSPAAFMVLLNDARARAGRPALAWDATLAAYAATNAAIHMPGSSGGAGQCWAQTRSYRHAFAMWAASPAHWQILMNARSSVGVALCPTGVTANAR